MKIIHTDTVASSTITRRRITGSATPTGSRGTHEDWSEPGDGKETHREGYPRLELRGRGGDPQELKYERTVG